MKLIDIMKAYHKAVLRENAKLKSIYNTLIREADEMNIEIDETDTEDDIEECDSEEKLAAETEDKNLDEDDQLMSAKEFFGDVSEDEETDTEIQECDDKEEPVEECDDKKPVEECDDKTDDKVNEGQDKLMSAKEFFGDVSEDEKDVEDVEDAEDVKEDEEEVEEDEEFEELDEDDEDEKLDEDEEIEELDEEDKMMSADEFFATANVK